MLFELMSLNEEQSHHAPHAIAPLRGRKRTMWATLAGAAVAASLTAGLTMFADIPRRPKGGSAVRFVASPPAAPGSSRSGGLAFVSPDGLQLVWVLSNDGKTVLATQRFDSSDPIYLAGTEGARWPFWSADSRAPGFFSQGALKRVDASGGPAVTIVQAPFGEGGTWSRNGVIVFAPDRGGPLYQVSAAGGRATPLTALDRSRGEVSHRWPVFLPDGRHFVYFASASQTEHRGLYVGDLGSSDRRWLGAADGGAAYTPPGYAQLFELQAAAYP